MGGKRTQKHVHVTWELCFAPRLRMTSLLMVSTLKIFGQGVTDVHVQFWLTSGAAKPCVFERPFERTEPLQRAKMSL